MNGHNQHPGQALGAISNQNPFGGVSKDPLAQRGLSAQTNPQSPPARKTLRALSDSFAEAFISMGHLRQQAEDIASRLGVARPPAGAVSGEVASHVAFAASLHDQFALLQREFAELRDALNSISNEVGA